MTAVAVGVFDGLHLGHVAILERARAKAGDGGPVVLTFDPHPDLVLRKSFEAVPPLTPFGEKRERLSALGISRFDVLPFTRELAALEPEAFVDAHLVRPFRMSWLVVGANFALGRGRTGDIERLRAIGATRGFQVDPVPLLELEGAPVSSTRIRGLLDTGRVAEAARLLGRRYDLAGTVVRGDGIGRTLGVPTANLRLHEEKLIPANGIYSAWARLPGERAWHPAAMSIGVRPTFGGQVRTIEVHVIDWSGELVGREVEVEFADWLRPEIRFDGAESLIQAMRADIAEARRRLGERRLEAPGSVAGPVGPRQSR